jgi:hypothetical protein
MAAAQDCNIFNRFNINIKHKLSPLCVGRAKSTKLPCTTAIAGEKFAEAERRLVGLLSIASDDAALKRQLNEIAGLCLCKRDHQNQADRIATEWFGLVRAEVERQGGRVPEDTASTTGTHEASSAPQDRSTSNEDLKAELRRLQREMQNMQQKFESVQRKAESQERKVESLQRELKNLQNRMRTASTAEESEEQARHEEQVRQEEARRQEHARQRDEAHRQEARRQAERDRAERDREEEKRAKGEHLHRKQVEASQRLREQETRERLREKQEWTESWVRYERDWTNMDRVDCSNLDEDVLESLPWPVKGGRWQDVNESNVETFLRHAPDGTSADPERFRDFLKTQLFRWHEDRIRYKFPGVAGRADVLGLLTLVVQVINRLREDVGKTL